MIQSLDPVGPGPRLEPIYLEGRGPIIDAEQARLLGLRNGQVVQAVIDNAGSAFSVLWPAGQRSGLPTALEAFPLPSNWRWAAGTTQDLMAMLMPGGHILLRPVKTGAAAQVAAAPAAAPAPSSSSGAGALLTVSREPPAPYSLGQAFAAAQGVLGGAGAGASAELARLLQQAPAWAGLLRLLNSLSQPELAAEAAQPGGAPPAALASRLADMLGTALPRMGGLSAAALQQALARSGLGTEAALLAGAVGLDQDLKVALRRLLRNLPPGSPGMEGALGRSVDTLERSQIDSLSAQMQGQVLLSLVIPFADAGPVALQIFRERQRRDEEPPPFVVDVHSAHSELGPLWLRTQVSQDRRVALTMWALRPEVAEQAREHSRALRLNLTQSGLSLASLEIVAGAPSTGEVAFSPQEMQA